MVARSYFPIESGLAATDPAIYLACNGVPFAIPTNERPHYPVILVDATAHQCKEFRATNIVVPMEIAFMDNRGNIFVLYEFSTSK